MGSSVLRGIGLGVALVAGCAAFGSLAETQAGTLLKWVDPEGHVHYGDKLPSSAAPLERERLNRQAVPIETIRPEHYPEHAGPDHSSERHAAQQAAYDTFLLRSFGTAEDLKAVRDRRLAAIDAELRMTATQSQKLKAQLGYLVAAAADLERLGEPVPGELVKAMGSTRSQMARNGDFAKQQEKKRLELAAKYAAGIHRLEDIQGQKATVTGVTDE
jgi:Domain of unknown function (DUF4124)